MPRYRNDKAEAKRRDLIHIESEIRRLEARAEEIREEIRKLESMPPDVAERAPHDLQTHG